MSNGNEGKGILKCKESNDNNRMRALQEVGFKITADGYTNKK